MITKNSTPVEEIRWLLDAIHDAVGNIRWALIIGDSDRERTNELLYRTLIMLRDRGVYHDCEWAEDPYADETKTMRGRRRHEDTEPANAQR